MMKLLLSFAIIIMFGCHHNDDCLNEVLSSEISENRMFTVTLFSRNCGATSSLAYIIAIRNSNSEFDPENENNYIFISTGSPNIRIKWDKNGRVEISGGGTSIFKQEKEWNGVEIVYQL